MGREQRNPRGAVWWLLAADPLGVGGRVGPFLDQACSGAQIRRLYKLGTGVLRLRYGAGSHCCHGAMYHLPAVFRWEVSEGKALK